MTDAITIIMITSEVFQKYTKRQKKLQLEIQNQYK